MCARGCDFPDYSRRDRRKPLAPSSAARRSAAIALVPKTSDAVRAGRHRFGVRDAGGTFCTDKRFHPRKMENTLVANKKSSRGRKQDRARVAGGQDYEVGYAARKAKASRAAVKKAVKKVGNSRKKVEWRFGR